MLKRVAVIQSNYIPWKGYFDIINDVDLFIFYDDVQYTKNDWRNRNKIKTPTGVQWLTIPTGASLNRRIFEVELVDKLWAVKHWKNLQQYYSKAPFFHYYRDFFEQVYLGTCWTNLSELNQFLIRRIATEYLGITTEFRDSREYSASGQQLERLICLLKKSGAEEYVSGPTARDYIDDNFFATEEIQLIYKDYSGYPEYPQVFAPFDHYVTILDLLFHVGPDAPYYIWGWRNDRSHLPITAYSNDLR